MATIEIKEFDAHDIEKLNSGDTVIIDDVIYKIVSKRMNHAEHTLVKITQYILQNIKDNTYWELLIDFKKGKLNSNEIFIDGFMYNNKILTQVEQITTTQYSYEYKE